MGSSFQPGREGGDHHEGVGHRGHYHRCDSNAAIQESIAVRKERKKYPVSVTSGPLRVPFQDLFLRDPVRNQSDLIFSDDDLREWAENIWEEY